MCHSDVDIGVSVTDIDIIVFEGVPKTGSSRSLGDRAFRRLYFWYAAGYSDPQSLVTAVNTTLQYYKYTSKSSPDTPAVLTNV